MAKNKKGAAPAVPLAQLLSTGFMSIIEAMLGGDITELQAQGAQDFPFIPRGSQHHAVAAQRSAEDMGFLLPQLLGLGVEGLEHLPGLIPGPGFGQFPDPMDTWNDLLANLYGAAIGTMPSQQLPPPGTRKAVKRK